MIVIIPSKMRADRIDSETNAHLKLRGDMPQKIQHYHALGKVPRF